MHRRAPAPNVDVHLEDGNRLYVGEIGLTALHTPGHTPDSMSMVAADRVFTGDTLMIRATGRADFAGGNPGEQYDSITRKLFALNDSTLVFPAHDYRGNTESTIGEEKRTNPRIAGRTRDAYVEMMNKVSNLEGGMLDWNEQKLPVER
jgi:glyoxylase-like metal-dependent hydrolase (beta-lactamase superfamily II)